MAKVYHLMYLETIEGTYKLKYHNHINNDLCNYMVLVIVFTT